MGGKILEIEYRVHQLGRDLNEEKCWGRPLLPKPQGKFRRKTFIQQRSMLLIKYVNNDGKLQEKYLRFFFLGGGRGNISFPNEAFIQLSHIDHTSSKF